MAGGAYVALSGLRARLDRLDQLAADIANVGTAGYKAERRAEEAAERMSFETVLESAIDVASSAAVVDFRAGTLAQTGYDLDFAIEGRGFFVLDGPAGPRYTRNGHFVRTADGTLTTSDGLAVQGESGPLKVPAGLVSVQPDGNVQVNGAPAGRLKVVDFPDYRVLRREGAARFAAADGTAAAATGAQVRGGALEQSNVSMMERVAQLTAVSRGFEALQRGVSILMNDIDGRAISELGRR